METNTAARTFVTDISVLPRSARARKNDASGFEACICCGLPVATQMLQVVTDQGAYTVGADCAKKCVKLGFEIEQISE